MLKMHHCQITSYTQRFNIKPFSNRSHHSACQRVEERMGNVSGAKSSWILQLPDETLDQIVAATALSYLSASSDINVDIFRLHRKEFAGLCRVHRRFHRVATPYLYRRVVLSTHPQDVGRATHLLRSLQQSPELGTMCQRAEIVIDEDTSTSELASMFELISEVMQLLPGVTVFEQHGLTPISRWKFLHKARIWGAHLHSLVVGDYFPLLETCQTVSEGFQNVKSLTLGKPFPGHEHHSAQTFFLVSSLEFCGPFIGRDGIVIKESVTVTDKKQKKIGQRWNREYH
jgi:hypothetical protein